ncbi:MAG TPA: M15 family metallopeptidase [Castellaniella sp.]|uniref:M15 family metallopeptidase n=1 Tax=Castellaniella sp. TaxID=1955812 RepID=UPI002EEB3842
MAALLCLALSTLSADARADTAQPACAPSAPPTAAYLEKIHELGQMLGITNDYGSKHGMMIEPQAARVVVAGKDIYGYDLTLAPAAADAYRRMIAAAAQDGVSIQGVSGFRSAQDQYDIMASDLRKGASLAHVLARNTPPGYSQHQTGRAIDLATPGSEPVTRAFASTIAYRWLAKHAASFGFSMTYPAGNSQGIEFEPWHWYYDTVECH